MLRAFLLFSFFLLSFFSQAQSYICTIKDHSLELPFIDSTDLTEPFLLEEVTKKNDQNLWTAQVGNVLWEIILDDAFISAEAFNSEHKRIEFRAERLGKVLRFTLLSHQQQTLDCSPNKTPVKSGATENHERENLENDQYLIPPGSIYWSIEDLFLTNR